MTSSTSRRFPSLGWAWPSGALDLLLTAAICADEARSRAALDLWFSAHDIDDVSFRDHRLLASIAERFARSLTGRPEQPRLIGLQRQLWSRSRMALAEAMPALRALTDAGIAVMLLKGAARLAAEPGTERARVAHDVDILVSPADFPRAMGILFDLGWQAASGSSRLGLEAKASSIRAMNFFRGRFGDIDLHQWAFGAAREHPALEDRLWTQAQPAMFLGLQVLVPSPADRLLLSIAGSGRDAHAHSDWMVDCAQIITGPTDLDWSDLVWALKTVGALVPAQVALLYLHEHQRLPMPKDAMAQLRAASGATASLSRIPDLLEARPRANWGPLSQVGRGLAKQWRMARMAKTQVPGQTIAGRLRRASFKGGSGEAVKILRLCDLSEMIDAGGMFRLELLIDLPGPARRLEFELNSETGHFARLQARVLYPRSGPARLTFCGSLDAVQDLPADVTAGLWLEARPGRYLRNATPAEAARYAAVPFRLLAFSNENR